jgi:hypothetical protein
MSIWPHLAINPFIESAYHIEIDYSIAFLHLGSNNNEITPKSRAIPTLHDQMEFFNEFHLGLLLWRPINNNWPPY